MTEAALNPKTPKAQATRASLVMAAAELLREEGPAAVTYRGVSKRAGAASSSVGYYFDSVNQLLGEAGRFNIQLWSERAELVAAQAQELDEGECRERATMLLIAACLPDDEATLPAHYAQLIAASDAPAVTDAYQTGHGELHDAVAAILKRAGLAGFPPSLVSMLVDGAAVAALSEGRNVHETAEAVLGQAIDLYERSQARVGCGCS